MSSETYIIDEEGIQVAYLKMSEQEVWVKVDYFRWNV